MIARLGSYSQHMNHRYKYCKLMRVNLPAGGAAVVVPSAPSPSPDDEAEPQQPLADSVPATD